MDRFRAAQEERSASDVRLRADPFWSQPGVVGSRSIGAGLGQDPNLFVEHAVRSAQRQWTHADSVVQGRLGRTSLAADGALPAPTLGDHRPGMRVSLPQAAEAQGLAPGQPDGAEPQGAAASEQSAGVPWAEEGAVPQAAVESPIALFAASGDEALRPDETADQPVVHGAPAFSEQLRGGSARLPVALRAPNLS